MNDVASCFMMWTLPQEPFHHDPAIAMATTVAILALPLVVILGARVRTVAFAAAGTSLYL